MRILFLAIKPAGKLAGHSARHHLHELYLKKFPGSVFYGPGYAYETNDVLEILEAYGGQNSFDAVWSHLPERVFLGEPFGENFIDHYSIPAKLWQFPVNLKNVRLPKIIDFSDFWHLCGNEWSQVFLQHQFDLAITGFVPPFIANETFTRFLPGEIREQTPFIPIPPYFSPRVCSDLQQNRSYDVLMGGAQAPEFYPVRWQMLQAFKTSSLSLYTPHHPGYNFHEHSLRSNRVHPYIQALNRSKISAFCSTRFHFAPMKLFEAMACGTIALCDAMHGIKHLGLTPDEHFILADGTDCVAKATALLQNIEKLEAMRNKAHAVVTSRHTVEHRANELAELIPATLNGEPPLHWAQASPNLRLVRARQRLASQQQHTPPKVTSSSIFDYALPVRKTTWDLWQRLGVMHFLPPEETQDRRIPALLSARHLLMGHSDLLKAELLVFLARQAHCRLVVEMGTEAGFFSMVLARWLHDESSEGHITTIDTVPHTAPFSFMTPFTMERFFSRLSLTTDLLGAEKITFLLPEEWRKNVAPQDSIDLLLLNRPGSIATDYAATRTFLGRQSIIVVNNYCEAAPAAIHDVRQFAARDGWTIEHVVQQANTDGLAVCRRQE